MFFSSMSYVCGTLYKKFAPLHFVQCQASDFVPTCSHLSIVFTYMCNVNTLKFVNSFPASDLLLALVWSSN